MGNCKFGAWSSDAGASRYNKKKEDKCVERCEETVCKDEFLDCIYNRPDTSSPYQYPNPLDFTPEKDSNGQPWKFRPN